jgi:hypothetical protein
MVIDNITIQCLIKINLLLLLPKGQNPLSYYLHSNEIIGVCPQIFDSVICDWPEPPRSLESPQSKQMAVKPQIEKNEMVFLCFR